jgi:transcriptional regulator with XRE-family HTH domain
MVRTSDTAITSSECRALGERLKRHRERRGITLESIAQTTKISARLFAALERGDCSRWPVGLYGRAYIRGYAEAIGLNADETAEDFTAAFGGTLQADGTPAPPRRTPRAATLRLAMVDEPSIGPEHIARRLGLAAADLIIGFLLAWIAYVGLNAGVWVTVGTALAYHGIGRLVSDQPLLYWAFLRIRSVFAHAPVEESTGEVAVRDTASTAA